LNNAADLTSAWVDQRFFAFQPIGLDPLLNETGIPANTTAVMLDPCNRYPTWDMGRVSQHAHARHTMDRPRTLAVAHQMQFVIVALLPTLGAICAHPNRSGQVAGLIEVALAASPVKLALAIDILARL
jgi:hypothetical protein